MIKKNTFIFLIVFIVLVIGYIFLDHKGWIDIFTPKDTATEPETNWMSIEIGTITSITFHLNDNDDTVIFNDGNDNWVAEEVGMEIEAGTIERIISELNAIIPLTIFTQSPDPEATGLLTPDLMINLSKDDKNIQIKFGTMNPVQTGYYAQIDSEKVVLIGKGSFQNFLSIIEEIQLPTIESGTEE